jgi:hypothetical protein
METLADNGAELLATPEEEFEAGPSGSTRVEEEILGRIVSTYPDQRDGEDLVTGVGGVELIHWYCDARAFDGPTFDIPTGLPDNFLSFVSV